MKTEQVAVTPTMAQEWLDKNSSNRPLRETTVKRLARDMIKDNWKITGDPIKFDTNGDLMDGQHRLSAILESGKTVEMSVAYDVPVEAMEALDTGVKRTLSDLLHWKGETNTNHLAAAIRLGYRWQHGQLFNYGNMMSHAEALDWYAHNPNIKEHFTTAARVSKKLKVPLPVILAFMHRVMLIDPDEAQGFMEQIEYGENVLSGDPAYALRNWLFNQATARHGHRPRSEHYLAMFVKAWNFFIKGESVKIIVFKRGGINKEEMPNLVNIEGTTVYLQNQLKKPVDIPVTFE